MFVCLNKQLKSSQELKPTCVSFSFIFGCSRGMQDRSNEYDGKREGETLEKTKPAFSALTSQKPGAF